MRAVKILGLSVSVINVMYSVVYMGIAGTDLYIVTDDVKTTSTILWLVGYFLNVALNVTVFMRILAKDTVDYVVYLLCTGALSIARFIFLKYKKDNGELEVYYILTDVYIVLSIAIMFFVFVNMEKPAGDYSQTRRDEALNRTQNQSSVENADKLEAGTALPTEAIALNNTHAAVQGNSNNVTSNRSETIDCCWYDTGPSFYPYGCCSSSDGDGRGGGGGEGGGCCSDGCCGDDDGCCAGDDDGCCNDGGCDDGCCDGGCEGGDGGCEGGDGGCEGGDGCDCDP